MSIKIDAIVYCPYCNNKSIAYMDCERWRNSSIIYCDSEKGGCDRQFVLDYLLEVKTNTRKIENE